MTTLESILATSESSVLANIFQIDYLSKENCEALTQKILAHRHSHPHEGSMQKYTVDVTSFLDDFLQKCLADLTPIVNALFDFGQPTKYTLYTAHAIVYNATGEGEKALKCHVDDSDITINLTLHTENLNGNELRFLQTTPYGNDLCLRQFERMRVKQNTTSTLTSLTPKPGWCVLHRGNHPHETSLIQSGQRLALILWLKKLSSN
jgi:hypothetical protein